MFGGINIDPQQMMQQQMQMEANAKMCAEHPECTGCPMYSLTGYNGTICENAIVRLNQGGNAHESGQSNSTQEGTS